MRQQLENLKKQAPKSVGPGSVSIFNMVSVQDLLLQDRRRCLALVPPSQRALMCYAQLQQASSCHAVQGKWCHPEVRGTRSE